MDLGKTITKKFLMKHDTNIFALCLSDGDGVLSMYELEYFYEEQQHRMEQLGIETLPFEDCLCQVRIKIKIAL